MTIAIDTGLRLIRYDLCETTPDNWDTKNHSNCTEYSNLNNNGNKNKEGFYFLFDNEQTCETVANVACKIKSKNEYWLTRTTTNKEIKIIDFSDCKCIHDILEIIDVLRLDVYNDHMKLNGLENKGKARMFSELKGHSRSTRISNQIPELIEVSWFGQLLTDFDNGTHFKKILTSLELDGYRWCEEYNPYGLTYCLLDAEKLNKPEKIQCKINSR